MKELIYKYKFQIIAVVILLILWLITNILVSKNAELHKKLDVATYNQKVFQDSVRLSKDKQGKEEYEKLAFLTTSVKQLAQLNQELAKEVRSIKGNVNTIIKSDIKVVEKPVPFTVKSEFVDSNVTVLFNYDTTYSEGNFKKLSGYTKYNLRDGTYLANKLVDETGMRFTTGVKNLDKGKPEIFLKSDYPGFTVTKLEGAELDPKLFKSKTPLVTPTITVGWTPLTYSNGVVQVDQASVGVTVGVGFNVLKLLKIKK